MWIINDVLGYNCNYADFKANNMIIIVVNKIKHQGYSLMLLLIRWIDKVSATFLVKKMGDSI